MKRGTTWSVQMSRTWASGSASVISVAMNPGATTLTVMFREASSRAAVRLKPTTAALLAE